MKTLAEHNKERTEAYDTARKKRQEPCANGIACPECGEELWDSNPMLTRSSSPPKKDVHCPKCDYRGYRVA